MKEIIAYDVIEVVKYPRRRIWIWPYYHLQRDSDNERVYYPIPTLLENVDFCSNPVFEFS